MLIAERNYERIDQKGNASGGDLHSVAYSKKTKQKTTTNNIHGGINKTVVFPLLI